MNHHKSAMAICTCLISFSILPVIAQPLPIDAYYFNGYRTRLTDPHGVDFAPGQTYYTTNTVSTEEQLRDVRDLHFEQNKTKDAVIIGHSQGGLRALAYASSAFDRRLSDGTETKIKAVVTIGSPIAGHLTVENRALSKKRFNRFRSRLVDGVLIGNPWTTGLPIPAALFAGIDKLANEMFGTSHASAVLDDLTLKFIAPGNDPMMKDILVGAPVTESIAAKDFERTSDFHIKYIEGEEWIPQAPVTMKAKDGIGIRKKSRFPFFEFYQKYRYYQVTPAPVRKAVPLFDSGTYYANIIGTQHDLDQMLEDTLSDSDYQLAKFAIKSYEDLTLFFGIADSAIAGICAGYGFAALAGFFTAPAAPYFFWQAAKWGAGAAFAYDGRNAMQQRNAEYGLILGSSNSDSFIQIADQSLSAEVLGTTKIDTTATGGRRVKNGIAQVFTNHAMEDKHPEIWGVGKKMGEPLANYLINPDAPDCIMKEVAVFLDDKGVILYSGDPQAGYKTGITTVAR